MKSKIETLKSLSEMEADKITATDREYIRKVSAELGVEFKPRPRCKDCYTEQAFILYRKLKDMQPKEADGRKWRMRAGVDVIYKGKRVNDDLLTDETAEEMLAVCLPSHWFYESK